MTGRIGALIASLSLGLVMLIPNDVAAAGTTATCDGKEPTSGTTYDGATNTYTGTTGDDVILVTAEQGPTVYGLAGDDTICSTVTGPNGWGYGFNVHAGRGNDRVFGGYEPDGLWGDQGKDYLYGGDDGDHARSDGFFGGPGADTLDGSDSDGDLAFFADVSPVQVDLAAGTAVSAKGTDALIHIKGVVGGPGDDVLKGDVRRNSLAGANGDDLLYGRGGMDGLWGNRGHDLADGGRKEDHCRAEVRVSCRHHW